MTATAAVRGADDNCCDGDAGLAAQLQRWKNRLKGLTDLSLPTCYPRPLPLPIIESQLSRELDDATCLRLLSLSMKLLPLDRQSTSQITPFTLLLASFALLLHRQTGEDDIVIGSSSAQCNPLVLRLPVTGTQSFADLVGTVKRVEEEALADEVPFDALLNSLANTDNTHHNHNHNYGGGGGVGSGGGGISSSSLVSTLTKVRFFNRTDTNSDTLASHASDLTVFIAQSPTARRLLPIEVRVIYNAVLFSEERINSILDQLDQIVQQVTADPSLAVDQVDLVTSAAKLTLPDPTVPVLPAKDVYWPGPIHRVFMENANKHPDRLCVVESVDCADQLASQFSYKEINDASTQLANNLLTNGVQAEDVVVIYAHRGVELVVAIMGVLKAGATFSVIDPQYPEARQKIYLSVARPSALIVLERAGCLLPEVERYLASNASSSTAAHAEKEGKEEGESGFQLKHRLVGLRLDPISKLLLAAQQPLEDSPTDPSLLPVVGPQSVGTLSFTSGSTGVPKGVRGRHFSLTFFYPWMQQEFHLSDQDRFTMLSGIAHDPIQRDIFTPLFLGAHLRIPTAEDIGQPGRLAQWMAENQITVTHLTPAMGQLLSANADTEISSLRNAFFVGDILTKRDVTRLQALARNVDIVNMYGTTETQRAVSYFKILSSATRESQSLSPIISSCAPAGSTADWSRLKDVMPAGIGMRGVQLLVVGRHGRLAGIGELGELFIRSFGLAEGYLRLPKDTNLKFVDNFFSCAAVDNPPMMMRDRMYRTGDLGRYRADGVVECCGRADDQVKIRGFRIELGEIDMHLSQHPAVRENVTLVRRDAYEEKTLVAYFVAHAPKNACRPDVSSIIADIRGYLRLKLPHYSVPSVFVPLVRMPLTPNGKVDKNALPYPDTAVVADTNCITTTTTSTTTTTESNNNNNKSISGSPVIMSALEKRLVSLWSAILFPPAGDGKQRRQVGVEENFFDLGGHSILATRLIFSIRQSLKLEGDQLPLNLLFRCPTVKQMAREIEALSGFGLVGNADDILPSPPPLLSSPNQLESSAETLTDLSAELARAIKLIPKPRANQQSAFQRHQCLQPDGSFEPQSVFLTGATGFLGAFLLHHLHRSFPRSTVHCLVRADSLATGRKRLEQNMRAHLLWTDVNADDYWQRTNVVLGDLSLPWLGIGAETASMESTPTAFQRLAESVDCVVHNGALVHWVFPYEKLKPANVLGTVEALKLCTMGPVLKPFYFVSSTSVLDTPFYTEQKSSSVREEDDLEGSRHGLKSGYGQSKWVAEKLLMSAASGPVGIPIAIIRPGYILGDTVTGVTNTDDFLWRLVKGCIELGQLPDIHNVVNACPVDYVARGICQVIRKAQPACDRHVYHVWNERPVRFLDFFQSLLDFGFAPLQFRPYLEWRDALTKLTMRGDDSALYPLLHFVLDDLPTSTKSPFLDCRNFRWALDGSNVGYQSLVRQDQGEQQWLMEKYLTYLCSVGFLDTPDCRSGSIILQPALMLKRSGK